MRIRIMAKSIIDRRWIFLAGVLAVALAALAVSTMAAFSLGIREKAGRELRAFGANILLIPVSTEGGGNLLSPAAEDYLSEERVAALDAAGGLAGHAPYLYGLGQVGGRRVLLVGTRIGQARTVSPWFGSRDVPEDAFDSGRSALAGVEAARSLGLRTGDSFRVTVGGREINLELSGILETGGQEDHQLFIGLGRLQEVTGRSGLVSLVQVSAQPRGRSIEAVAAELERLVPGSRARVVEQVARAESRVLGKLERLMGLVSLAVVTASGLSVASFATASVLRRRREIGIMKALGGDEKSIATLIRAESLAAGVAGGLAGLLGGFGLSQVIGRSVFRSGLDFSWPVLAVTLAASVLLSWIGSRGPAAQALRTNPAVTLKGE